MSKRVSINIHVNCLQNISIDGVTAHLNGNTKCDMDSFEFNGLESDKIKDSSLIQDFERIQKDTTDFCNIQVQYFLSSYLYQYS